MLVLGGRTKMGSVKKGKKLRKIKKLPLIGLAIWQLKCFYETLVQGSRVILFNFSAKIRQLANPKIVSRKYEAVDSAVALKDYKLFDIFTPNKED